MTYFFCSFKSSFLLPEYYDQIKVMYVVQIDQNVDQEKLFQLMQQHLLLNKLLHYHHSPIEKKIIYILYKTKQHTRAPTTAPSQPLVPHIQCARNG
jgi:hypothetical protein